MSPQPHEVPRATVAGAVAALAKWMRARSAAAPPSLLTDERDDLLVLLLTLRRAAPANPSPTSKPLLLPLPHPVLAHASASVCLISDDRASSRGPPADSLLETAKSLHLPVADVIPLSSLRSDFRPYESRRRLAASHDLFLADRAILPLLPHVLGKAFYSTKKAPLAIDLSRAGWPEQLRRVLSSTFLYLRTGACSGIKVGRLDMAEEEIVDNVMAVMEAAVERVPKKWANVRSLHLKSVDSVSLPIYQAVPDMGMKIDVPVVGLVGDVGGGEVVDAGKGNGGKKKAKKSLRYVDGDGELEGGEEAAGEESAKRKRNKEKNDEDAVNTEETEKRKRKKGPGVEEVEDVGKKKKGKKGKSKPALEELEEEEEEYVGVMEEESQPEEEVEDVGKKKKGKKDKSKAALEKEEEVVEKKRGRKDKSKTALDEEVVNAGEVEEESQPEGEVEDVGKKKNGRMVELMLPLEVEDLSKKKKKGMEEDSKPELELKKKGKGKGESSKAESGNNEGKKKRSKRGKGDDVEVRAEDDGNDELGAATKGKKKKQGAEIVDEAVEAYLVASDDEVCVPREEQKRKGKKLDGKKMTKTGTR